MGMPRDDESPRRHLRWKARRACGCRATDGMLFRDASEQHQEAEKGNRKSEGEVEGAETVAIGVGRQRICAPPPSPGATHRPGGGRDGRRSATRGVGVMMQCQHLCMESRGIKSPSTLTRTTAFPGVYRARRKPAQRFSCQKRARALTDTSRIGVTNE